MHWKLIFDHFLQQDPVFGLPVWSGPVTSNHSQPFSCTVKRSAHAQPALTRAEVTHAAGQWQQPAAAAGRLPVQHHHLNLLSRPVRRAIILQPRDGSTSTAAVVFWPARAATTIGQLQQYSNDCTRVTIAPVGLLTLTLQASCCRNLLD